MEDSKLKVVSKELVVTDDLIIPGTTQIDLTKILEKAMEVSGLHDNYLQFKKIIHGSSLNMRFEFLKKQNLMLHLRLIRDSLKLTVSSVLDVIAL